MNIRSMFAGFFVLGLVSSACSSGELSPSKEQVGAVQQALCTGNGDCGLYACNGGVCEVGCHSNTDCIAGATCVERECTIEGDPNPCAPLVIAFPITSCSDAFDCTPGDRCPAYAGYICCHDPGTGG